MQKHLLTFLLSIFYAIVSMTAFAAEVTVTTGTDAGGHTLVPVGASTSALGAASVNYATQQLYLASELGGSSKAGNITAVSFHYKTGINYVNARTSWKLYINTTSETDLEDNKFLDKGTLVYSSTSFNVPNADEWYKLDFSSGFAWNGTDNIVITIIDDSNTTMPISKSHWAYTTTSARSIYLRKGTDEDIPDPLTGTTSSRKDTYVANAKFTIYQPDVVAPTTPTDLSVSATTTSSATLAWSSVSGATSYDLQKSTDGDTWSELATGVTGTSYSWADLTASSTQYARIRATNAVGSSDWSYAVTVTTDAVYKYDDITFDKWSSTSSIPTSGDYYLNNDINFEAYANDVITLTDNLNLCLNGKTVNMEAARIVVPDGYTLTIYNNSSAEGKITSFVASQVGIVENLVTSLIVVRSGGTLVLKEGTIENTYDPDDDGNSYAIYSNGTLHISGDVLINSNSADIYLYASNVITLDGAISNAEKHSVYKNGGAFTSGWSTYMSGENPRDYFVSANSAKSVCLNGGEASLQTLLTLSETALNSSIGSNDGQVVDVNLTRPLTSSQYNTFCLPFDLDDDQLQEYFGAGYDLEEFVSSSIEGNVLNLAFDRVYELEAGKPYLFKPASDISSVLFFDDVTISKDEVVTETSDVDFHAVYGTTALSNGDQNILFLGADNELFWPSAESQNMKGFRAYFQIKGPAASVARRARIIKQENTATGMEEIEDPQSSNRKLIKDGQLYIMHNGSMYNVQGVRVK